jgi:hypothetical protein
LKTGFAVCLSVVIVVKLWCSRTRRGREGGEDLVREEEEEEAGREGGEQAAGSSYEAHHT